MTSEFPTGGRPDPSQDPYGQPGFGGQQPGPSYGQGQPPYAGQPGRYPSNQPYGQQPPQQGAGPVYEQMSTGSGAPVPPGPPSGKRGRKGLVIGLVAGAAVLAGGGVWAWQAFMSQGPQPAEALPDDTLAYISVDLDPSGEQKIEALKALRKFPAFKENVGLDTDDDVRKKIFEEIQNSGACKELDYKDDIEPWLGDRAALAVVDQGHEYPDPVFVVQVKDQDEAEDGLNKLVNCGNEMTGESEDIGGYAFNGDWVILAETEKIAEKVVSDAKDASLDEDGDYKKWTKAAGDPGVMNFYASAEGGDALAEHADELFGASQAMTSDQGTGEGPDDEGTTEEVPDEFTAALKDFEGGAGTVRFDDGNLEVEFATGQLNTSTSKMISGDRGDDTLSTLPASTAVALGAGFEDGWGDVLLEQLKPLIESESGMSYDEAIADLESETGLSVPDDVEVLLGESFVVALDSNFDANQVESMGPEGLSVAVKVKGDADKIEAVLDKIRAQLGTDSDVISSTAKDGYVVVGPSQDYIDKVSEEGDLGDDKTFKSVVPHAEDASAILYANFDAGDWLTEALEAAGAPHEVLENAEPLEAFGFSSWTDGDEVHTLLTVTTE
ncbi:DUF3352 domain-containing protein [Nocardioides sp. Root151]|uniref:DUF3352 domain-containing protein n=1 Tax=Nocardioides sp. Root151 TaxID=1736475 RepID=UPI0007023FA3|nr:DUF3352 domain-containing protein [Nocardioides sp. Root151]KQZ69922.1 hypothetical protein ASD66_09500 [Nocardioides sp. Root151]